MNILFVRSQYEIASTEKPLRNLAQIPLGVSYISACLKQNGHRTRGLHLSRVSGRKKNEVLIDRYLRDFDPRIVAFTAVSTEFAYMAETARYIRKHYPGRYLVIGGVHVSLNPDGVLGDFDALCIGEGEYPMVELAEQLDRGVDPSGIPNLWIRRGNRVEKNAPRPFVRDLDALPFPDRDLWKPWVGKDPRPLYSLIIARGCPFECTYCCNHALKKIAHGTYVRFRSPENIVAELKDIHRKDPGQREFSFEVETLTLNKSWALALCRRLAAYNATLRRKLIITLNMRVTPGLDLSDYFKVFGKAGIRTVFFGLESGSETIRRTVLNRRYSNDDIIDAVKLGKKYGLKMGLYSMMGLPGETPATIRETIAVNRCCQPDWIFNSIFYPYPGTRLYGYCKKKKLLPDPLPTDKERGRAVLNLPGITRRQIEDERRWFDFQVYYGKRPTADICAYVLNKGFRPPASRR